MKKRSQIRLLISSLEKVQRELGAGDFSPTDIYLLNELQSCLAQTMTVVQKTATVSPINEKSEGGATNRSLEGPQEESLTFSEIIRIAENSWSEEQIEAAGAQTCPDQF
jgi:hypothetical protein